MSARLAPPHPHSKLALGASSLHVPRVNWVQSPGSRLACSALLAACVSLWGCSKQEPDFYEPSDPHPASGSPSAQAQVQATYRVAAGSSVSFELRSKDVTTRGSMGVMRGEFQVNLADLSASLGYVEVDLGSLRLASFDEEADNKLQAERARNWLNLGANRPEAARELSRWARFEFQSLAAAEPSNAALGKLIRRLPLPGAAPSSSVGAAAAAIPPSAPAPTPVKPPAPTPGQDIELYDDVDTGSSAEPGQAAAPKPGEVRRALVSVDGQLRVNGFRKATDAKLELLFEFAEPASAGGEPRRVLVKSTKPLRVALGDHDIKPRDASGVLEAGKAELLARAGREARVSVDLILEPK